MSLSLFPFLQRIHSPSPGLAGWRWGSKIEEGVNNCAVDVSPMLCFHGAFNSYSPAPGASHSWDLPSLEILLAGLASPQCVSLWALSFYPFRLFKSIMTFHLLSTCAYCGWGFQMTPALIRDGVCVSVSCFSYCFMVFSDGMWGNRKVNLQTLKTRSIQLFKYNYDKGPQEIFYERF